MIYIHVPFCHRKCTYCAFYSKVENGKWKLERFVDALLSEMERRKNEQDHPIKTIYFGGGTPSILPLTELGRVVEGLHRNFDLSQMEEMTLEANPEDLTERYLSGLVDFGFNRLSVGIQSLDNEVLRLLNRRHTAQQAIGAVENAHRAGLSNISVDFIYGLPNNLRSLEIPDIPDFLEKVSHVSAYALTVEPGTALAVQVRQGKVVLPEDDEVVWQYHALHDWLEAKGFRQYEVSNYARQGFESKHNSRYWDRTPYLGLGPGAHSFDGRRRMWNSQMGVENGEWTVECEELLTDIDAYNEMLMTALRTTIGLPKGAVRIDRMQRFIDCGWLVVADGYYRPTHEGLLHADGMAAELFV